jgi:hypothetical protein
MSTSKKRLPKRKRTAKTTPMATIKLKKIKLSLPPLAFLHGHKKAQQNKTELTIIGTSVHCLCVSSFILLLGPADS